MSKLDRLTLPLILVSVLVTACGDDNNDTTGPTIADLAGTWSMTAGTLTVDPQISPTPIPLTVATQGIDLEISNAGEFTLTITTITGPATVITGEFEITGSNRANIINDDDPDNPLPATFSLSNDGDTLNVQVDDAELLDLTGDDVPDPGDLDITFERQ